MIPTIYRAPQQNDRTTEVLNILMTTLSSTEQITFIEETSASCSREAQERPPEECCGKLDEHLHGSVSSAIISDLPSIEILTEQIPEIDVDKNSSSANSGTMKRALEECCRQSDDYFHGAGCESSAIPSDLPPMVKLAHKCVSVQFLLEFNERVVQPYRMDMTVKQVVEEIIIPATRDQQCSFIDQLRPNMHVAPHAFISHAFGNPFSIIVESLKSYFKDAVYSEVYVWIDIFIINQHSPGNDLHGGKTLKATIEASEAVVVCLDKKTLPLFRLWCLYEIGSTPIDKLVLLTHGFDAAELGLAYSKIDATTADCWAQSDRDMIRGHIRTMMIEQKIVGSGSTVYNALKAFTRVLKLLLILKPTSYAVDMAALLKQATGYEQYPLKETVEQACTGGRLICIPGGSGEGKSTLAAALVKRISIDACHFFKLADVRRQDTGLILRSLSYQLAIHHPAFAQALLDMSPSQVETLSDEVTAFKLLLETPLKAARGLRATILIDALDESGGDGRMISLLVDLDNVLREEGKSTSRINIIVTTRPDPALLFLLMSHWKGDRYQEITPAVLRAEEQTHDSALSPLLRTLIVLIRRTYPDLITFQLEPRDLNAAYELIFDRGGLTQAQHRAVLEVVLASYEPQSLSDLKAMGLLEMARKLPGYGELFLERENKLHLLHRSIAEWLLDPEQGAVDAKRGHERLAEHIWETALRPWLLPPSSSVTSSSISWEPSSGSYALKYALAHLREVGRLNDIQAILFRLPWLQAMLKEKGLGALIKDILSLTAHPTLAAAAKKLVAVLRLSSSALIGNDAWKCLPSQLLGRLRETEEEDSFRQLREEANSFTAAAWLKPLKISLKMPGSLEMTLIGHKNPIAALSILPDGRIVSGSYDRTIRIWNSSSGDCDRILSGHEGGVTALCILPDGRIVSGSNDKTIRIWNSSSRDCDKILSGHQDPVAALCVLPDGRIVSGSEDKTIRIWNSSNGDCDRILSGHKHPVTALCILPDGRIVSGSGDQTIRIWNSSSGNCDRILSGNKDPVTALCVLPDGRIVSSGCWDKRTIIDLSDKTIRIWNSSSGNCDRILSGNQDGVTALSILPDGRIISGSNDKTIRIWNSSSGNCDRILSGNQERVTALSILPDSRIVSGYGDNNICIWNSSSDDCDYEKLIAGHKGSVTALSILLDGRIVSSSVDKTIRIWNSSSGDCDRILSGHECHVYALSILPDGRIVSGSRDNTIRIWNSFSGDCEKILSGHKNGVRALCVLPDGRIVSGSWDATIRIWNSFSGDCDKILSGHEGGVEEVVALSDGRLFSRDNLKNCLLWSPVEEEEDGGGCLRMLGCVRFWLGKGGGFRSEEVSFQEYDRLKNGASSFNSGKVGQVAPGYSVMQNCLQSESFGRVFVDEEVLWVVKSGDVIAVFENNGRDHWFREVSG